MANTDNILDSQSCPWNNTFGGSGPAYNAGTPQIKCYINQYCPFSKTEYVDHVLNVNGSSIGGYSDEERKLFDSVDGLEGIFLKPLKSYNHNFLEDSFSVKIGSTGTSLSGGVFAKSELPAEKVFLEEPEDKDHQMWQIVPSFFDDVGDGPLYIYNYNDISVKTADCLNKAKWKYGYELGYNETASQDKYQKASKSSSQQNGPVGIFPNNNGNLSSWQDSYVQVLQQTATENCNGLGIHWRLCKKRDIFQGEDFSIDFYKKAIASDISGAINEEDKSFRGLVPEYYKALDFTNQNTVSLYMKDVDNAGYGLSTDIKSNYAVGSPVFDFTNQAYYIVELGYGVSNSRKFFIILAQNSSPTFVEVVSLPQGKYVSFAHGIFEDISSNQLLKNNFRMTVRSHLGQIVITFEGEQLGRYDWIVTGIETYGAKVTENGNTDLMWRKGFLTIPRGKICIMGGNMVSAFGFQPVKYPLWGYLKVPRGENQFSTPSESSEVAVLLSASSGAGNSKNILRSSSPNRRAYSDIYTCDADEIMEYSSVDRGRNSYRAIDFYVTDKSSKGISNKRVLKDKSQGVTGSRIGLAVVDRGSSADKWFKFFYVGLNVYAGHYLFPDGYTLLNCKTPIVTVMRITASPSTDSLWDTANSTFVIEDSVLSFSESWSKQDRFSIDHQGKIDFLVNKSNPDYGVISSLQKKAFYIRVVAKYGKHGAKAPWMGKKKKYTSESQFNIEAMGNIPQHPAVIPAGGSTCNYTCLEGDFEHVLFTGICYGGIISHERGKHIMTCSINDYSQVLEDKIILNSPFFDGFYDIQAIMQLFEMAQFRTDLETLTIGESLSPYRSPGHFLAEISPKCDGGSEIKDYLDLSNRRAIYVRYALPDSWDKLQNPFFKFKDGETFWNAIKQMSEQSGNIPFFDAYGVFHYERNPYEVLRENVARSQFGDRDAGDMQTSYRAVKYFSTDPDVAIGQRVFNATTNEIGIVDTYNTIKVQSATAPKNARDADIGGGIIMKDIQNLQSMLDPNSDGFLGYRKMNFQVQPLGDEQSVTRFARYNMSILSTPLKIIKFETYGNPLRAMDIISVDNQPYLITKIDSTFDPEKNYWWQTIEGEWLDINIETLNYDIDN